MAKYWRAASVWPLHRGRRTDFKREGHVSLRNFIEVVGKSPDQFSEDPAKPGGYFFVSNRAFV